MNVKENCQKNFYSLIPLEEFKAILGIDDREDNLSRYCLTTATYSIEQYCMRRLLRKRHFERIEFSGELILPLNEYPVSNVLAVYLNTREKVEIRNEKRGISNEEILEPEFYEVVPQCGSSEDWPYSLVLSPALQRFPELAAVKVIYIAGYVTNPHPCGFVTRSFCDAKTPAKAMKTAASLPRVPADLASACLELAAWNMNRYKGRRIGMTGNVRKGGESFELSMPVQVRQLLEPYRRKVI